MATPGFCDFCNPSNAKPSFLRVGGGRFRHFFECFSEGRFWMPLFPDFCRFLSFLGRLLDVLWAPFPVYVSGHFFDEFGIPTGVTNRWGRRASPLQCFSTFWLKPAISPCVFEVFRFSGFRCRWRERFPLEIYLSERESRWSIPVVRQPAFENHTPRVPEARWRIYIYIYIYMWRVWS